MSEPYEAQRRGDADAYNRYLRGMDASMRQKVALTAAHLLCEGEVADMGMGSGTGSFALASLYPSLSVIGVDVDPAIVALARDRYRLPNLRFVEGDVAERCFEAGELEAIIDSSVLHHVTSYGGYDRPAAARALAVQVEQLSDHGVLIVRDFLDPGPQTVWLDLPTDDGESEAADGDPLSCSTAALFERFAREFRVLHERPELRGFPYRAVAGTDASPVAAGFRRYELSHSHAVEFVLRKDYRSDWEAEVKEEYTYATQSEFETICSGLGLRVLASTPIRNPWIVRHRFRDRFELRDLSGRRLDFPATNYVIVGQKVPTGHGVRFVEGEPAEPKGYLELSHYRCDRTGRVYDLVRRPFSTIDVLPWYRADGSVQVLARRSYPRPILAHRHGASTAIGGAARAHYVTEPLNIQQGDKPLGQTVEELLCEFPDIGSDGIVAFEPGTEYYPSPGGLQEQIQSVFVEIDPVRVQSRMRNKSGFSTSGILRAMDAHQLLRAAQVGGLPEARLELNVYDLLLRQRVDPGAWIGETMELSDGVAPLHRRPMSELSCRAARRLFRRAHEADSSGFLELRCALFSELDGEGVPVAGQPLEFVVPRPRSLNTVAVAPLRQHDGEIFLGLDDHDLPAAQCFSGNSQLLVAPAWRLPHDVGGIADSRQWILDRLEAEYGVRVGGVWELGGHYLPSPGVTPEAVHPLAVDVVDEGTAPLSLTWVALRDAVEQRAALRDGHLRIVALRAAHALGVLGAAVCGPTPLQCTEHDTQGS